MLRRAPNGMSGRDAGSGIGAFLSSLTDPPWAQVEKGSQRHEALKILAEIQVNKWSLLVITYSTTISAC